MNIGKMRRTSLLLLLVKSLLDNVESGLKKYFLKIKESLVSKKRM